MNESGGPRPDAGEGGRAAPIVRVEILPWLGRRVDPGCGGTLRLALPFSPGETVGDLFASLAERYPGFAEIVFDRANGCLYECANVVINDRLFEAQGGLGAPLRDGDEIVIVPAYAGGSQEE